MKRVLTLVLFALVAALPTVVLAQAPNAGMGAQAPAAAAPVADPTSRLLKSSFDSITRYLVASAEKMPEENFAFKPTPEVRSFGEILGHVANTHFSYCSRIKGEKNPNDGNNIEKKTAKADIVKALNESVAYCSAVYQDMTDAKLLEPLPPAVPAAGAKPPAAAAPAQGSKPAPPPAPRIGRLLANITHDWEHYGNLVTYLRLKGLVPPSSEGR
jgi:uncharacterized damage-inducible protein DinB